MRRGSNFRKPYPPEFRREAVEVVPAVGPAAGGDRGRSRRVDGDAAELGAPGRCRCRSPEGADERGAGGAARAAPEGAGCSSRNARDLEKSHGSLRAGERDAVSLFRFIAAETANYPISLLCRVLGVSRSGFHAWERRAPPERELGGRRAGRADPRDLHAEPGDLRRPADLPGAPPRGRPDRPQAGRAADAAAGLSDTCRVPSSDDVPRARRQGRHDLVEPDFYPPAPNRLWCADIKYVSTWEGSLYLASVIDCFSRKIVGWSMPPACRPNSSSTRSRWRSDAASRPGS